MAEFSERIKELRISFNYSQQKLADMLGVSKSTINMYERGERKPGIDQLEAIADYFNVDMDYLSGKSDIPRKSLIGSKQMPISISNYNSEENNLVIKYRKLDEYGQKAVNLIVDAELERCTEQKTTDISEYTQNIAAGTGGEGFDGEKINEVNDFARKIAELENNSE